MATKKKSTHKRGCKCVVCEHKRRKRTPAKKTAAKKSARKKNPVEVGKLGKWVKASAVRVRKVAGRLLVDLKG